MNREVNQSKWCFVKLNKSRLKKQLNSLLKSVVHMNNFLVNNIEYTWKHNLFASSVSKDGNTLFIWRKTIKKKYDNFVMAAQECAICNILNFEENTFLNIMYRKICSIYIFFFTNSIQFIFVWVYSHFKNKYYI